jgi:hypothetical protein
MSVDDKFRSTPPDDHGSSSPCTHTHTHTERDVGSMVGETHGGSLGLIISPMSRSTGDPKGGYRGQRTFEKTIFDADSIFRPP